MTPVHALARFVDFAHAHPDDRWLTTLDASSSETVRYGEALDRIAGWATACASRGIRPGDVVFVLGGSGIDAVAAFLGAVAIGAVPSFLPPISPRQDPRGYWDAQVAVAARVEPRLILASGETLREGRTRLGPALVDLASVVVDDGAPGRGRSLRSADLVRFPVAFLQHTSGTTGLKKGVEIGHESLCGQLDAYADRLGLTAADSVASWLPLYHDMGLVACLWLSLRHDLPLTLVDPFDWVMRPELLFDAVTRHRATLAWMPNFAFNHLARVPLRHAHDLSTLRRLVNCSEPCRAESMSALARVGAPLGLDPAALTVCYAMAETVFAVCQPPVSAPVRTLEVDRAALEDREEIRPGAGTVLVSSGPPLDGVEVTVVDADRRPLPEGRIGEIVVRAPFLAAGYHRLPEETARRFADGAYSTGDRGFLHDGELFVLGRLDDVVIVRGRKVDAAQVEHLLAQVDGLHRGRVVAFGVWNEAQGSHDLAVLYEAAADAPVAVDVRKAIREHVHGTFALHPAIVEPRPAGWICKSTSGKIARAANARKYRQEALP